MRALAVGMVVIYHIAPSRVPGGFTGVDVFFVISGFLITTHLLSKPPRTFFDLVEFWGRRIRRLLPASFTVIIITLITVLLFAPPTQWRPNAHSALAAGLYLENWSLAQSSVDYLAASSKPDALQHFWSLSVEEQFYLLWPILILFAVVMSMHYRLKHSYTTGLAICVVLAVSFGLSIWYTNTSPAPAYFVTFTRMWELASGGLLAVTYPRIRYVLSKWPLIQLGLVMAGICAIAWSVFLIPQQLFPGWIAIIPILGSLLIIAAGPTDHHISIDRILGTRPVQFLGDISYSIYLWHYPVIVLSPQILGHPLQGYEELLLLPVILLLSWASKTLIEDRFRGQHPLGRPARRTIIFLLVGTLITSSSSVIVLAVTQSIGDAGEPIVIPSTATCVGAAIRLDPSCKNHEPHGQTLYVTPMQAIEDKSELYSEDCRWDPTSPQRFPFCTFGSPNEASARIALFGNSHAVSLFPPILQIAQESAYTLDTYLSSSCVPSTQATSLSPITARLGCLDFTERSLTSMIDNRTDLVIISALSGGPQTSLSDIHSTMQHASLREMFSSLITRLTASGINVLVIRDVPRASTAAPDCVAQHLDNTQACDGLRSERLFADALFEAAQAASDPLVSTLDFTEAICDVDKCMDVIGGVIVYFDSHHLTRTFSLTLKPYIEDATNAALSN